MPGIGSNIQRTTACSVGAHPGPYLAASVYAIYQVQEATLQVVLLLDCDRKVELPKPCAQGCIKVGWPTEAAPPLRLHEQGIAGSAFIEGTHVGMDGG